MHSLGQHELKVLPGSQIGQELGRLEEIGASLSPLHTALERGLSCEDVEKRRLSRATLAQNGGDLPLVQCKRNIVERGDPVIFLAYVP